MAEWFDRTFQPSNAPDWALSSKEKKSRESTTRNEEQAVIAEQKAVADVQKAEEEKKNKTIARLNTSTSGFSGGTNTARSFLTTF